MPLFPDDPDELCAPGDVARAILADDYTLSNAEVALRCRFKAAQVKAIRYQMVCHGLIPPSRVTAPQPPRFKPLPPPPRELAEGACVGSPDADAWTSGDPDRRTFAQTSAAGPATCRKRAWPPLFSAD